MSNNSPAFPLSREQDGWHQPGMSLRDWFAGQALGAVIRQCAGDTALGYPDGIESMEQFFAVKAFALADAMLAHREKSS